MDAFSRINLLFRNAGEGAKSKLPRPAKSLFEQEDLVNLSRTAMASSDSDDGFHISEDLVPIAAIKHAGIASLDFDGMLPRPLKLYEDLKEGCGGQLWPAGMELTRYLLKPERKASLSGKKMYVSF